MQLPLQDFATLLRSMAASVQASATALIDLTAGSVLRAILEANASIALWMQWLIMQVLTATRASTSVGGDLDSWVADFGMTRLPGQAATVNLTFSRITPGFAASIPVGAQAKTADGATTFIVVADPSNPAFTAATNSYALAAPTASITVAAQAALPGAAGNAQAGAVSLLASAMPGIDQVNNALPAAGGADPESDAALRARFTNFIDSRSRATPAAIAFAIQSLQQGLSYVLAENMDPSGAARPGFFTLTVDDGSGRPPNTTLAAVSAAIETVRPIGTQFAVQPPVLTTANVNLAITTPAATHTTAQTGAAAAIRAYLSGMPIGAALPTARLAALAFAADPSITDVTSITINGAGDLQPGTNGIIRPGTITVN